MRYQPASQRVSGSGLNDLANAVAKLVDGLLNRIFTLKHEAANLRSMIISVSFIVIWVLLAFTSRTSAENSTLLKNWLEVVKAGDSQKILISSFTGLATIFLNLVVVRHLLALYVPFWLMKHVAAIYLADIFEKEENVAHTFVEQAAFGGYYHTIHIRQGKVAAGNEESPIIQIGGPGYVVVELDSAVVLESPDGTARVVDSREIPGNKKIHGFERIRQGVDLRDVIQKQDITSRSRDGILVTAKDVQYSFSIYRGLNPVKSRQTPFPVDENAVFNLVYGAPRTVKLNELSEHKPDWMEPLPGKNVGQIAAEMNNFINKRSLSDFLIAIEKPDSAGPLESKQGRVEQFDIISGNNENRVDQTSVPALQGNPASVQIVNSTSQPNLSNQAEAAGKTLQFVPRSTLTKMFYDSFQAKANPVNYLNWIGVGTWDTPAQAQIILKNHLEAWKISRENFVRGNPTELKRISEEARQRQFSQLIEDVLLRSFYSAPQDQNIDQEIKALLQEYLEVLERSVEYFRPDIPDEILDAIKEIYRWIYPEHHSV